MCTQSRRVYRLAEASAEKEVSMSSAAPALMSRFAALMAVDVRVCVGSSFVAGLSAVLSLLLLRLLRDEMNGAAVPHGSLRPHSAVLGCTSLG